MQKKVKKLGNGKRNAKEGKEIGNLRRNSKEGKENVIWENECRKVNKMGNKKWNAKEDKENWGIGEGMQRKVKKRE